jgi:hypothetical protein
LTDCIDRIWQIRSMLGWFADNDMCKILCACKGHTEFMKTLIEDEIMLKYAILLFHNIASTNEPELIKSVIQPAGIAFLKISRITALPHCSLMEMKLLMRLILMTVNLGVVHGNLLSKDVLEGIVSFQVDKSNLLMHLTVLASLKAKGQSISAPLVMSGVTCTFTDDFFLPGAPYNPKMKLSSETGQFGAGGFRSEKLGLGLKRSLYQNRGLSNQLNEESIDANEETLKSLCFSLSTFIYSGSMIKNLSIFNSLVTKLVNCCEAITALNDDVDILTVHDLARILLCGDASFLTDSKNLAFCVVKLISSKHLLLQSIGAAICARGNFNSNMEVCNFLASSKLDAFSLRVLTEHFAFSQDTISVEKTALMIGEFSRSMKYDSLSYCLGILCAFVKLKDKLVEFLDDQVIHGLSVRFKALNIIECVTMFLELCILPALETGRIFKGDAIASICETVEVCLRSNENYRRLVGFRVLRKLLDHEDAMAYILHSKCYLPMVDLISVDPSSAISRFSIVLLGLILCKDPATARGLQEPIVSGICKVLDQCSSSSFDQYICSILAVYVGFNVNSAKLIPGFLNSLDKLGDFEDPEIAVKIVDDTWEVLGRHQKSVIICCMGVKGYPKQGYGFFNDRI